ncbi:hypothetical protein HDU83_007317 [Entophlyctis luteolus]|nr:hypothetical protein HDU83_007317 [Entophlyctis luteolus]
MSDSLPARSGSRVRQRLNNTNDAAPASVSASATGRPLPHSNPTSALPRSNYSSAADRAFDASMPPPPPADISPPPPAATAATTNANQNETPDPPHKAHPQHRHPPGDLRQMDDQLPPAFYQVPGPYNSNGFHEDKPGPSDYEHSGFDRFSVGEPPKKKSAIERYLCCCCPKNKKHRMICIGVVLVVLIVLGVLIGIYFPRYPEIKVYDAVISSPFSFSVATPNDYNTINLRVNLTMDIGTYNPNRYNLDILSINLVALLAVNTSVIYNTLYTTPLTSFSTLVNLIPVPADASQYTASTTPQVGTASYGAIRYPTLANVNYTMIFEFNYSPDQHVGLLKDPGVNEIASACGITSRTGSQRPLVFTYTANTRINKLESIGINPSIGGQISFICPFSESQITSVVNAVESGSSIMDAVTSVFG